MILAHALVLGLAAAGLTAVVRAVVPTLWLLHKPLSCDLCMSWWTTLTLGALHAWHYAQEPAPAVLAIFAAIAVALTATKAANRLSS